MELRLAQVRKGHAISDIITIMLQSIQTIPHELAKTHAQMPFCLSVYTTWKQMLSQLHINV